MTGGLDDLGHQGRPLDCAGGNGLHFRGGRRGSAGGQIGREVGRHANRHPGSSEPGGVRRQQLPAHERRLPAEPVLPEPADQRRQRREAATGLDLPDRGEGIARDEPDRRQRRHVRHDLVQPRLRARRPDRRGDLALQAQDGTDHRLLLRPEQPRRRGLRRHGLHGDARREACRARRQDRQARLGDARSPIRNSATARRWRRPPSTARS